MFQMVKAHTDFLREAAKSISGDKFATLRKQHVEQLTRSLGEVLATSSLRDATDCLQCLSESCFSDEDQTTLKNVIMRMGSDAPDPTPTRMALKPQEHLWMHRYLTAKDWDVLTDRAINFGIKIDRMVKRASAIGLLSMQETTAKHITSVIIVASAQPCDLPQSYDRLLEVKMCFQRMRQHRPESVKPTMTRFPCDVIEFCISYPTAYLADEMPVESQVDEQTVRELATAMPARKTHACLHANPMSAMMKGGRMSATHGLDWLVPLAQALASKSPDRVPLTMTGSGASSATGTAAGGLAAGSLERQPNMPLALKDLGQEPESNEALPVPEGVSPAQDDGPSTPAKPTLDVAGPKSAAEVAAAVQAALKNKKAVNAAAKKAEKAAAKEEADASLSTGGTRKRPAASISSPSATMDASGGGSRPKMPPLKQMPPVKYLNCTVYSCQAASKWRAICIKNPRYDRGFAWSKGNASWTACMEWCESQSDE